MALNSHEHILLCFSRCSFKEAHRVDSKISSIFLCKDILTLGTGEILNPLGFRIVYAFELLLGFLRIIYGTSSVGLRVSNSLCMKCKLIEVLANGLCSYYVYF
ncbi:unnamed protein product [Moneuplotes crassus]|uniref:Uncharacterized protein n=1 Tax=Euplotes crassus TaxID=5936 RepID=A0AAD2D473_EUPCR|nr:unnamed protein product [Moneuplotes crassus]